MAKSKPKPEYETVRHGAIRIGMHPDALRAYIAEGKLPAYRLAGYGHLRVRIADVDALLVKEKVALPRLTGAVVVGADGNRVWSLAPNGEWMDWHGAPVHDSAVELALTNGGRVAHPGVDLDLPF